MNARLIDGLVHATFSTGFQSLTRCGCRVTWLDMAPDHPLNPKVEWTEDLVDCPACLEENP